MTPKDATRILSDLATYLRLTGANEFKVVAFDKAARIFENLPADELAQHLEDESLESVDGIGKSIARELYSFHSTGTSERMDDLREAVPGSLIGWLEISGLGPKKIYKIHRELEITELDELKEACADGRVAGLKGLGQKTADNILKSIEWMETFEDRCRLDQAEAAATPFLAALEGLKGVQEISVAGSLRRRRETVGDIDLLVAAKEKDAAAIMKAFVELPAVTEVLVSGSTKSSVRSDEGRQVDLRVVEPEKFGSALMYFTGSKEHNIEMRSRARERGMALNEYGLYQLDDDGSTDFEQPVESGSEAAIYKVLELPFVPPECREDTGEFEEKDFPLLETADIRGILHAHSTWSDGKDSIEAMARACIERGFEYLGLTDHSQAAAYAGGLSPERVEAQWLEIDEVNQKLVDEGHTFKVFKGIEADILGDGSLDYEKEGLIEGFEFVIASVHSALEMPAAKMQARMEAAAANPHTTIIGHPTGRLLLKRAESQVDLPALIQVAAEHGSAIEINANPWRLDIDWREGPAMRRSDLRTAICPDAHAVDQIDLLRFGVDVARKARIKKANVLNTLSLVEIEAAFDKA